MEIDFDDEEAFEKLQAKLREREIHHEELKDKLEKVKEEEEEQI